jgi:D-alanyl-D-alanine carboxypeptidase
MHAKLLSALLVLILGCTPWLDEVAAEPGPTLADELQQVLDTELVRRNGVGYSAAVIIPGRTPWYGVSGVSHGTTSITGNMVFGIASTTKSFIAALVLQLAEEGKLSLEDPLSNYIPGYPNIDGTATIRQLLNHTSGIHDFIHHPSIWDTIFANTLKLWEPEEILTTFVLQPYFSPGAGWHYSSTNYILLGMIVEVITGSKVSTELRNRFFTPLGLSRTYFDVEEQVAGDIAHRWYDISGDGIPDDISFLIRTSEFSAYWTASAIFTTAADLAKWSHALFRGNVLRQSSLEQMLAFHSPTPGEPLISGYGLGTIKVAPEIISGEEAIGHEGWIFGYSSVMLYFPEYEVSMSILMNKNDQMGLAAIASAFIEVVKKHLGRNRAMPWIPILLLDD